jgi:hypothetical protein
MTLTAPGTDRNTDHGTFASAGDDDDDDGVW